MDLCGFKASLGYTGNSKLDCADKTQERVEEKWEQGNRARENTQLWSRMLRLSVTNFKEPQIFVCKAEHHPQDYPMSWKRGCMPRHLVDRRQDGWLAGRLGVRHSTTMATVWWNKKMGWFWVTSGCCAVGTPGTSCCPLAPNESLHQRGRSAGARLAWLTHTSCGRHRKTMHTSYS